MSDRNSCSKTLLLLPRGSPTVHLHVVGKALHRLLHVTTSGEVVFILSVFRECTLSFNEHALGPAIWRTSCGGGSSWVVNRTARHAPFLGRLPLACACSITAKHSLCLEASTPACPERREFCGHASLLQGYTAEQGDQRTWVILYQNHGGPCCWNPTHFPRHSPFL